MEIAKLEDFLSPAIQVVKGHSLRSFKPLTHLCCQCLPQHTLLIQVVKNEKPLTPQIQIDSMTTRNSCVMIKYKEG